MTWDLIVIGAGSAGSVIAARVSELSNKRVLLIEAGPDYGDDDIPQDLLDGRQNSMRAHDWGYKMRVNDRMRVAFDFPRGKVVGGSSAVNTCIAMRGRPKDYEAWGFPEWKWDQCLPAFKRLERDLDFGDRPWHGASGPVPIRRFAPEERVPWQAGFIAAALEAGFPPCDDVNDPNMPAGIGPHAMNVINGERMSMARCYLTPEVRARDNFDLRANTIARRLLVRNGTVEGVEVDTLGTIETLYSREIVLCGGAIGTPGLMLRSGLGPRESVARIGVPLEVEVPGVAEQLWEHPGSAIFFRPRRGVMRFTHPLIQTVLRLDDMYLQAGSRVPIPHVTLPLLSITGHVGKPKLASRIVFTSANPTARPFIDARALVDPVDREKMRDTLMIGSRFVLEGGMGKLARPFFPNVRVLRDPSALDEWLMTWAGTGYHPCGTVPMGVSCDARGRVQGVANLYVADASLIPEIPMANTNLTVIMMGERFGQWLAEVV